MDLEPLQSVPVIAAIVSTVWNLFQLVTKVISSFRSRLIHDRTGSRFRPHNKKGWISFANIISGVLLITSVPILIAWFLTTRSEFSKTEKMLIDILPPYTQTLEVKQRFIINKAHLRALISQTDSLSACLIRTLEEVSSVHDLLIEKINSAWEAKLLLDSLEREERILADRTTFLSELSTLYSSATKQIDSISKKEIEFTIDIRTRNEILKAFADSLSSRDLRMSSNFINDFRHEPISLLDGINSNFILPSESFLRNIKPELLCFSLQPDFKPVLSLSSISYVVADSSIFSLLEANILVRQKYNIMLEQTIERNTLLKKQLETKSDEYLELEKISLASVSRLRKRLPEIIKMHQKAVTICEDNKYSHLKVLSEYSKRGHELRQEYKKHISLLSYVDSLAVSFFSNPDILLSKGIPDF